MPLIAKKETGFGNLEELHASVLDSKNFFTEIPDEEIGPIMDIVLARKNLETIKGATLLGSFIHYRNSMDPKLEKKVAYIKRVLDQANIE